VLHRIDNGVDSETCVVLLHGFGANEYDLMGLSELFSGANVVSFQAPIDLSYLGYFGGRAWFPLEFTHSGIEYDESEVLKAIDLITNELKILRASFGKLYVCGFSQGAILTHAVFLKGDVELDGIAGLSGRYNDSVFDPALLKNVVDKPVFLSHGTGDEVIPVSSGREIQKFYEGSGVRLDAHEYRMGHDINFDCQKDIQSWFAQLA